MAPGTLCVARHYAGPLAGRYALRMLNTASVQIDLNALRENLAVVRSLCPHSRILAMVKADAYGHGIVPVAKALAAADGLAVAHLSEARLLRGAGVTQRLLLLATLLDEAELVWCSNQGIDVTAHDQSSVAAIAAVARHAPLRVWLKLDSGMHRIGLDPGAFVEADRVLSRHAGVAELVHMTHFASAGDPDSAAMDLQLSCFRKCHQANPAAKVSLANSAALIARPETRADWVRPGIMLYGDNPVAARQPLPLRAAMSLRAHIVAIRAIAAHESVGYHARWTSTRPSRIATVGIGYGDGYPRHAANGTPVWIDGQLAPVVGTISMDSIGVDVTDCQRASVGGVVTLWGTELPAATIAEHASTISYQLFTALSQRVNREYLA